MATWINQSNYKYLFIISVFLNTLNLKYLGINHNPLYFIVLLLGIIYIIYALITKQLAFKQYSLSLLWLYVFFVSIGTLHNPFSTYKSYEMLAITLIIFTLIFSNFKNRTLVELKLERQKIIELLSYLMFSASSISIIMFLFNFSSSANGVNIGLIDNRLWGIFFNPNPAAFLAIITIVLNIIFTNIKTNKFNQLNIIVQFTYVLMANSRTALLALILVVLALSYLFIFKARNYKFIKSLLASIIIVVLTISVTNLLQELLFIIPKLQGASFEEGGRLDLSLLIQAFNLLRTDFYANFEEAFTIFNQFSSGRIELWYNTLNTYSHYPLFGIGLENFTANLRYFNPESVVMKQNILIAHNVFLESLVVGGIFGFISFTTFTIKSLVNVFKVNLRYFNEPGFRFIFGSLIIVGIDFLGSNLDYGVFYVYTLASVLFWLFLGYLYAFNTNDTVYIDDLSNLDYDEITLESKGHYPLDLQAITQYQILSNQDNLVKVNVVINNGSLTNNSVRYKVSLKRPSTNQSLVKELPNLLNYELNKLVKEGL